MPGRILSKLDRRATFSLEILSKMDWLLGQKAAQLPGKVVRRSRGEFPQSSPTKRTVKRPLGSQTRPVCPETVISLLASTTLVICTKRAVFLFLFSPLRDPSCRLEFHFHFSGQFSSALEGEIYIYSPASNTTQWQTVRAERPILI